MISATSFRWYFVPLFVLCLRLARPAFFLVNLMSKSAGYVAHILVWVFSLLVNAFGTVNAVVALAVCIWPFWFYLKTALSGHPKAPQEHHQKQHPATLEDDLEESPDIPIPDLEEDLDHDPLPEPIPTHRHKPKKSKRRVSSQGGRSTTAPPTTAAGTSSARSSNGTLSNGDSPGYGHGYGQPLVPPITSDNSFYYGKRWFQRCKAASYTFRTRSMMTGYVQARRQSSKDPSLPISSPVLERLELVPVPAAPKDTPPHLPPPPPTPAGPRVAEDSIPLFALPDKPRRTPQEGRSPHQRPSNRLARRSNKTSRPLALSTPGLPEALPSPVPSTQYAYSPMIVEVEHDESVVLTHRLELLSIKSPPPSPLLVKMASPIIDHNTRDPGLAVVFSELATECDEYSDSSDDSMDLDGSDFSDSDSMDIGHCLMDVDPAPMEVDVDMDAWDHPPVESPFLGNSYAPSLRYRLTGLSLAPTWEDPYHDPNMLVDTC